MCQDHGTPTRFGRKWRRRSYAMPLMILAAVIMAGNLATGLASMHWLHRFLLGAVLTVILTAGGFMLAPGERYKLTTQVWLAAYGAWAGQWITTVALAGFDAVAVRAEIALFGLAFTILWPGVRDLQVEYERKHCPQHRRGRKAPAKEPKPRTLTEYDQLGRIILNGGVNGMEVIERKPTKAGFALHLVPCTKSLPAAAENGQVKCWSCNTDHGGNTGITYQTLRGKVENLETAFSRALRGLRPGSVRVTRARNADDTHEITHEFYIYIDVRDVLADRVELVRDHEPMSVYDMFTVGYYSDGDPIVLTIDEIHVMLIGSTGSGKSNFLEVLMFLLSRCYDAKLVFLDGKGGATIRRWLEMWAEGKAIRPLFDWVAVNRFEAERILRAFVDLIEDRPRRRKGSKWKATATEPVWFIITDEFAAFGGSHEGPNVSTDGDGAASGAMQKLYTVISAKGRSEGIWSIRTSQRSTVSMAGNGDDQANNRGRVVFPVTQTGDASQALAGAADQDISRMAAAMVHPGSVFLRGLAGCKPDTPGRVMFFGDDDEHDANVYEASIEHAKIPAATCDGDLPILRKWGYDDRWDGNHRFAWFYGVEPNPPLTRPVALGQSVPRQNNSATQLPRTGPVSPMVQSVMDAMRGANGPSAVPAQTGKPPVDPDAWMGVTTALSDVAQLGQQIISGGGDEAATSAAPTGIAVASGRDPLDQAILDVLEKVGTTGATGAEIGSELIRKNVLTEKQRTNVYGRLRSLMADGLAATPTPDAKRGARFYLPQYWR